jgi:hypothetical protein
VSDVTEVAPQLFRDALEAALLQRLQGVEQRPDRTMELDHLALQVVDAGRRGRDVVVEDVLLHLLDVVLDRIGDGDVVVDDLVEDGPYRGRGPEPQQIRPMFEPLPGRVQLAARTMPHGDHVARAREHVDLAEVDLLAVLVVVRGLQDQEHVLVVVLDLRALVGLRRVLDR